MAKKELTKKELEEGLKALMTSMTSGMEKEDRENPIFKFLLTQIKYIKDPDTFYTMAIHPVERVIETFVKQNFKSKDILIGNIYAHYNFFENNVSRLCSEMYGMGCSVDRGSFLVGQAIKWKETGKMPVFDWKQEFTYHYPETGTPKQWMEFIEGLQRLLYGYRKEYLLSLQELMKAHNDKVKPIQKRRKK